MKRLSRAIFVLLLYEFMCFCVPSFVGAVSEEVASAVEALPPRNGDPTGAGVVPALATSSWSWELTMNRQSGRVSPASLPDSWENAASLTWIPELDASGNHLGWNLTLGEPSENLLIDPAISHGPQPCQFYGWQFLPVIEGSLGLQREWRLKGGVLRVLILDYALDGKSLIELTARCEWLPEPVLSPGP